MSVTTNNAASAAAEIEGDVSVQAYTGDGRDWDSFLRKTAGAKFFHQIGWREVLERAFRYKSRYLVAKSGDAVVGVLPLFEVRRPFGTPALLSVPFGVEGGVCAETAAARVALEEAAIRLTDQLGGSYLELRDGLGGDETFGVREGSYFGFRRAILPSDEGNLTAIPRKQRRMVRVGEKKGLVSEISTDLDAFHDLYARSVRQLGTPVFPASYFRLLLEVFPEDCELLIVRHEGTGVAGVLSFYFNDTVLPYYAGSRKEFYRFGVNDFMYWELMRRARERGMKTFDFGRSKKGTGAYDFKCHWGFEPQALRYRVYTRGVAQQSDRTASDPRLQLLRRTWSRLPLPITKLLGPTFIRHFGAQYT